MTDFKSDQPHRIIGVLKSLKRTIKICCNYNSVSICSLQILKEILKKELIEFEITVTKNAMNPYDIYIDLVSNNGLFIFGTKFCDMDDSIAETQIEVKKKKKHKNTPIEEYKTENIQTDGLILDLNLFKGNMNPSIAKTPKDTIIGSHSYPTEAHLDISMKYTGSGINEYGTINSFSESMNVFPVTIQPSETINNYAIEIETNSLIILYDMAKSLNHLNSDIIWPLAICVASNLVSTEDLKECNSSESECDDENMHYFSTFSNELQYQIKKCRSGATDGIYRQYGFYPPFVFHQPLFDSLFNDNKLLKKYRKPKPRSIYRRLAHLGISISESKHKFGNINLQTKKLLEKGITKRINYVYKQGYSKPISFEENYFVMMYYLAMNEPLKALLCLKERQSIEKGMFLHNAVMKLVHKYNYKIKTISDKKLLFVDIKSCKEFFRKEIILYCLYKKYTEIYNDSTFVLICENFNCNSSCILSESTFGAEKLYEKCFLIERKHLKIVLSTLIES